VSITTTTTLETVLDLIRLRLTYLFDTQAATASNRVMVVDRLRLQDASVPNLQIEPLNLQAIGEYTSMNVMVFEYKVHAVVKVELDMGERAKKRMVGDSEKGAFAWAVRVADRLIGYKPNTGSEPQSFMRLENGTHDDVAGLASAAAQFRTMVRLMNDG
jgi:hypothetical protein